MDLALWTALTIGFSEAYLSQNKPHFQRRKVVETTYLPGVAFSEQAFIPMKITAKIPNSVSSLLLFF